jgi:hypothetical protein
MRKLTALVIAAACALLSAAPAYAADICYIREYETIGIAGVQPAQIAAEPGVVDQVTSDYTSGPVQSNAFNAATSMIELWCNTQVSYLIGTNPTASSSTNMPLAARTSKFIGVPIGGSYKISVTLNSQ